MCLSKLKILKNKLLELDFWAREPLEAAALFTRGHPGSQSQTPAVWSGGTLTAQTEKKLKNLTFITLAVASQRRRDPRRDPRLRYSHPPTPPHPSSLRELHPPISFLINDTNYSQLNSMWLRTGEGLAPLWGDQRMSLIPGHPPGNHLSALFLLPPPPPPPPQQELLRSLITLTTADAARSSLLEGQVQGLGLGARPTWEDLNKSRFSKTLKLGGGVGGL